MMDLKVNGVCDDNSSVPASYEELDGSGNTQLVESCGTEVSPIIHLGSDGNINPGHSILSTVDTGTSDGTTSTVIVENYETGQDEIVQLDLAAGGQELLEKITSQDAECQTMLEELMENLNNDNPANYSSVANKASTSSLVVQTAQTNVTPISGDIDMSKPFPIGSQTEAVINGKKCILIVNSDNGQVCAYPISDGDENVKKKRGRPRRVVKTTSSESIEDFLEGESETGESQTDAAEGLLELYNTGPDGVRRSVRKRIRAKALEDYEVNRVPTLKAILKKTPDALKSQPVLPTPAPLKRKRGRPRRYPRLGEGNPTQIPAVVIPGPNGQTLMMAPIKGLQNLQAFQQQMNTLPPLAPQPGPAVITNVVSNTQIVKGPDNSGDKININGLMTTTGATEGQMIQSLSTSGSAAPKEAGDHVSAEKDNTVLTELISMSTTSTPDGKVTVLKLSDDMINLYTKKEPIKLGLKATENDLERLKCTKCNFQAYFPQQYQDHISQHVDDVQKCKCCKYVSFDKLEILHHTREFHPRCICELCDFTAEHAYMIKRHTVRHNGEGFTCDICGKTYKDKYILKMHRKMVHMPADVLFGCNTCDKRFTRKAHLKRHLRIHEADKPHKCSMCDYKGCARSDLLKHKLIHRDPEYLCDICGKQFRHVKNKELHVKRHRGQKDYKCGICDFFGYTFTDVRKHIERKHSEVNKTLESYACICDRCGLSFENGAQLEEHRAECFGLTIEQTLSITNAAGKTSRAILRLPRSVELNGEEINITVEEVPMEELEVDLEEHGITLTEDQLVQAVHDSQHSMEFDSEVACLEQLTVANPREAEGMLPIPE